VVSTVREKQEQQLADELNRLVIEEGDSTLVAV
jgi:hypothetical protein